MSAFSNIWKIKELRSRIFFTMGLIFICRILAIVPTPGVDATALGELVRTGAGGMLGMFDVFSGGALSKCAVGTLGIWPYITASIIIQLMTAIVPSLEKMAREGESGRQKLNQITRYLTLVLCTVYAIGTANLLMHSGRLLGVSRPIVADPGLGFIVLTVICLTSATMFTMWLGEQITERGIGNGVSLIIMINICSRLPQALVETAQLFMPAGGLAAKFSIFHLVFLIALAALVFAGTVALTQGVRKIPIHTARRSIGNKTTGGQNTYMPLRVNYTGVMPIIFAGPIIGVIGWLFSRVNVTWLKWLGDFGKSIQDRGSAYLVLFSLLIIFFSFFWVATQFNAVRIADELKSGGSYIPGIRPGTPTAEFLDMTMTRVTVIGAIGLVIIAVLPLLLNKTVGIPPGLSDFFGGTSLLIIVGVALDTMRQVESYLVMRNYEGFLKHGRLRGRGGR